MRIEEYFEMLSGLECVEWSSFFWKKSCHMYVHVHYQIGLNKLIKMIYFIFNLNAYFLHN